MEIASLVGWIPALVFPLATALQLAAILRARSAKGVSIAAWLLFALANVSLYLYVGKYGELQSILAGLGTATLNLAIVAAALLYRGNTPNASTASNGRASPPPASS
jgi:uncharacterized protein with PQ loop repeat